MEVEETLSTQKEEIRGPNFATFHFCHVSDVADDSEVDPEAVSEAAEAEEEDGGSEDSHREDFLEELEEFTMFESDDFPYRNLSDDEETKKRTPRFDKEESSTSLQPKYTRKLTYSAEDVKRLAAEAEILVLRRRRYVLQSSDSEGEHRKREWRKSLPCRLEQVPRSKERHRAGNLHSQESLRGNLHSRGNSNSLTSSVELSVSSGSFGSGSTGEIMTPDKGYESLALISSTPESSHETRMSPSSWRRKKTTSTRDSPSSWKKTTSRDSPSKRLHNNSVSRSVEAGGQHPSLGAIPSEDCSSGSEDGRTVRRTVMQRRKTSTRRREQQQVQGSKARIEYRKAEESRTEYHKAEENRTEFSKTEESRTEYRKAEEVKARYNGRFSVQSNYSSAESQLWDKEDYLSEYQYEENLDEEGIRTILSLGEDFSNLSQEDDLSNAHHEEDDLSSLTSELSATSDESSARRCCHGGDEDCSNEDDLLDTKDDEDWSELMSETLCSKHSDLQSSTDYLQSSGDYLQSSEDYLLCDDDYFNLIKNKDEDISDVEPLPGDDVTEVTATASNDNLGDKAIEQHAFVDQEEKGMKDKILIEDVSGDETLTQPGVDALATQASDANSAHEDEVIPALQGVGAHALKTRVQMIKRILQEIIQSNRSSFEEKNIEPSNRVKTYKEQSEVLFKLKKEIFDLNLSVHRLQEQPKQRRKHQSEGRSSPPAVQHGDLQDLRSEVVNLYTLLREARSFLYWNLDLSNHQVNHRRTTTSRRKKKSGKLTAGAGASSSSSSEESRTEDSGYSDSVESKERGGQTEAEAGSEAGWKNFMFSWSTLGRVSLLSCLVVAALLPITVYSQARCCDHINNYSSWIQYQHVNGPPPI